MSIKNYRYKERRNMMIRRIGFWVGEIAGAVFLAGFLIQFCFQIVAVHGESMQPTYQDGDRVFVNKLGYRFNDPARMDVTLLEIENGTSVHYTVKRVIGLPGEKIQIADGKIWIDGKETGISFEEEILSPGLASYEVELGEDEYFVMGDNCNNSEDSRAANIGNIKRTQFVGKISGRIQKGQ
ncbi:MAG: signal peptidase I [Eubacteriales bacterium]|nr:signal peptidase I [Eubacteriales bacterium]